MMDGGCVILLVVSFLRDTLSGSGFMTKYTTGYFVVGSRLAQLLLGKRCLI